MQTIEPDELANVGGGINGRRVHDAWASGVDWAIGRGGWNPDGLGATISQNLRAAASLGTLGAFPIVAGWATGAYDFGSQMIGR